MLNQNLGVGATYESSHWMLGCQFQQDNVTPRSAHIPINGVVIKKILCTKLACLKSRVQIVGKKIRRDATQLQGRSKLNYFQRCFWQQIQNEHIYFNRFVPSSVRISFEITFSFQSVWKQRAIWFFFPFLSDYYMFLSNQVKTLLHLLEYVTLLGAPLHFKGIFRLLLTLPEEQKLQFIEKDIDR